MSTFERTLLNIQVVNYSRQYSAVWLNLAVWFLIYSAVWLNIRPSGFLFIWPSGFSRMDKFNYDICILRRYIWNILQWNKRHEMHENAHWRLLDTTRKGRWQKSIRLAWLLVNMVERSTSNQIVDKF